MTNFHIFKHLSALLLFLSACFMAEGASFMPPVINYAPEIYGGGNQNWQCAQTPEGWMVFANRDGLTAFEGGSWKTYQLPHGFHVRSVLPISDRVYVGSYEDFGYLKVNPTGGLDYVSLAAQIPDFPITNCDVQSIVMLGDTVFFQSSDAWFRYADGKVKPFMTKDVHPSAFFQCGDRAFAQLRGRGFSQLLPDGSFRQEISRSALGDEEVATLIPLPSQGAPTSSTIDDMLLVTRQGNIWRYTTGTLTPFSTSPSGVLRDTNPLSGLRLRDGTIMVGTRSDGAFAFSPQGKLLYHFDNTNSFRHDTVFGLCQDDEGNVWAALDVGVAQIAWDAPIQVLRPEQTAPQIGMIYDVEVFNGDYYIASSEGLWKYSPVKGKFEIAGDIHSQTNFVRKIFGNLYVGTSTKLCKIDPSGEFHTVVPTGCIDVTGFRGALFVTTYSNAMIVREDDTYNVLDGFSAPMLRPVYATDGVLWMSHLYNGAVKMSLTDDLQSIRSVERITGISKPEGARVKQGPIVAFWIAGTVIINDGKEYFNYNPSSKELNPYPPLNNIMEPDNKVLTVLWLGNDRSVFACTNGYMFVKGDGKGGLKVEERVPVEAFGNPGMGGFNLVRGRADNDTLLFNLDNAIGRYIIKDESATHAAMPKRKLRKASITARMPDGTTRSFPLNEVAEIPFNYSHIDIAVSYPRFNHKPITYHYHLSGRGDRQDIKSQAPSVTFGQLSSGGHTLHVEAFDELEQPLGDMEIKFKVLPPLHATWWAFGIYGVVLLWIIYAFGRWRVKRNDKRRQQEFEAHQQKDALVISEQNRMIALQKQQLLESQLQTKSAQITTASMGLLSKNRALDALRERIRENIEKNQYGRIYLENLLGEIDAGASSDDFWKLYQENFDQIHTNFFTILRERYPSLTPSDLRFCALLRLNLSTKDIAQMTNLTVRGVEAARYRLRRKLSDLPEGANLVDFLISLK